MAGLWDSLRIVHLFVELLMAALHRFGFDNFDAKPWDGKCQ